MTCLEAQSNIMAFVDKKLPEANISKFVKHIKYCPNCAEELEIYYTFIVGMRQIDNNGELSTDFKKSMNQELDRLDNKVKKAQRIKGSTFFAAVAGVIVLGVFLYLGTLSKVNNIEQRIIKERQGTTFNYDYFGKYLCLSDRDIIDENRDYAVVEEKTNYDLIREYNLKYKLDNNDNEENDNNLDDEDEVVE